MLVLNLPFKALMFLTLMRPSLVLFLVLWLKLVKDFLDRKSGSAGMPRPILFPYTTLFRSGGAMSKLFGGGQKAASGGIQGDVLATDNNTVGMGDAGIKSAIQGSNVPNPDEAVPSFVSGAMAKAGKGLL